MLQRALLITCVRGVHTGETLNGINRTMKKVMGYTGKKKHRYSDSAVMPKPTAFSEGAHEGKRSANSKRATVLNKLFMKHITDQMMTGESASSFAGYGIEINRVQVAPDYKGVNVFWIAKGTSNDEAIEEILKAQSGQLRHELTQLRIMGVVPRIYFIKDKRYAQIMEIDVRLAKADFGEDYVPLEPALKLRSHFELNLKLEPHVKEKIVKLEAEEAAIEDDDSLPVMSQNLFGLNHAEIMDRIMKSMKKSQALHRLEEPERYEASCNLHPVEYSSAKARREAFKQFLLQRQILQSKIQKVEREQQQEIEYLQGDYESQVHDLESEAHDLESFTLDKFKDYIDDDDGVK